MAWVCVGGIIFCLHFKRASLLVFSLLTDKDELMSHKQCFFLGLFDSALSIGSIHRSSQRLQSLFH